MPRRTPKRNKTKELFWRKAIAGKLASGLTQDAFCKREGINTNSFSWWRGEISKRDKVSANKSSAPHKQALFVAIAPVPTTIENSDIRKPIAEIDLARGVVRIFAGIDRHALHEIITVLREVTH